jgi:topoisomerase-4 subunit A
MTQGIADVSNYNDGLRGGRIRVRAKLVNWTKYLGDYQIPFSQIRRL